jgi:hypothetical protein
MTQEGNPSSASTPELKRLPLGDRIGQGAFGDAYLLLDAKNNKKSVKNLRTDPARLIQSVIEFSDS